MKYKVVIRYGYGADTQIITQEWPEKHLTEFFEEWDSRFTCPGKCHAGNFDSEWWEDNTNLNPYSIQDVYVIEIINEDNNEQT